MRNIEQKTLRFNKKMLWTILGFSTLYIEVRGKTKSEALETVGSILISPWMTTKGHSDLHLPKGATLAN